MIVKYTINIIDIKRSFYNRAMKYAHLKPYCNAIPVQRYCFDDETHLKIYTFVN